MAHAEHDVENMRESWIVIVIVIVVSFLDKGTQTDVLDVRTVSTLIFRIEEVFVVTLTLDRQIVRDIHYPIDGLLVVRDSLTDPIL